MDAGAFACGVSAGAGLTGAGEHPNMNPAARIATDNFFIRRSTIGFLKEFCLH
jgi:hypothetical protein